MMDHGAVDAFSATSAWDPQRPPDPELIKDCVHCGFCLTTCPSYAVFGTEMDSPRGRIVLMRAGHEPGAVATPQLREHFDTCLGCMACVTACPSGVKYDHLLEHVRPQLERRGPAGGRADVPAGRVRPVHPPGGCGPPAAVAPPEAGPVSGSGPDRVALAPRLSLAAMVRRLPVTPARVPVRHGRVA
jgi:glycolate oxidase iron-sulfur subunit